MVRVREDSTASSSDPFDYIGYELKGWSARGFQRRRYRPLGVGQDRALRVRTGLEDWLPPIELECTSDSVEHERPNRLFD